jgi:hypothetical protein
VNLPGGFEEIPHVRYVEWRADPAYAAAGLAAQS